MKNSFAFLYLIILFSNCSKAQPVKEEIQNTDPVISNDFLTLKLDLTRGGAISYLSMD